MNGVKVSDLKAHLSEHLRAVEDGQTIVVLHRRRPIAQIVPWTGDAQELSVRPATRTFGSISAPPDAAVEPEALRAALADERQSQR